ncbi:MAG: DNA polymerase IV [Sphingobacteriales bacterium 50-39]|nr:DNA polymerase IV [Sphingobacteriales bacterium]OJW59262.1 MAG: DNA polymerase IV [Sphingobacteriales bacterium 50-39]
MAEKTPAHREVVHLDLDTFFVSVERLKNSTLNGKPVIIGGGDRGVVAACSYETRVFGVHSAMPMKLALRLCPQALVIRGDHEDYSKYSRMVTDVIASRVPLYEKASIDEFYVDMTGMEKFFGTRLFSAELKQTIRRETGLPITYALASNKLVSKIATNEVKPNGQIEIPFGREKDYLAPLAIQKMPGVGDKTGALLKQMGIKTIRLLSEIPVEMLETIFGKFGRDLWRKAQGIDESPVIPYSEQKSIGTENTFEADTINIRFLESELVRMTEKIAFELRQDGRLTGCITLKLRYSDFNTLTKQAVIPYTASDLVLLKKAKELFHRLYDRRLRVRLLGIRFTHLIPGTYQINLFEDTQEMISLYQQIDSIKSQFGETLLKRASSMVK